MIYWPLPCGREDSSDRFSILGNMADAAVDRVRYGRTAKCIRRLEAGGTSAELDAEDILDVLRTELRRFKEWPYRSQEWDDPCGDERREAVTDPVLVRSVVWELFRDFGDWPTWRQVVDRLVTVLGIPHDLASNIAIGVARADPASGVHAVYPSHLLPRRHRCDDMVDYRWILEERFMAQEETKYQWRVLLGDDGLRYRTALTLLMEPPLLVVPPLRLVA